MTTIRLGTGADAVDVEDGAKVPMKARDWGRDDRFWATLRLIDDVPVLKFGASVFNVQVDDGTTSHRDGWHIDLDVLRRERVPKAVMAEGWTNQKTDMAVMLYRGTPPSYAQYWTSRPDNTPEKQAAFDAAVEALLSVPSDDPWKVVEVRAALMSHARALGYGKP